MKTTMKTNTTLRALIVRHPFVDQLLDGSKTVEYRSRPTRIRGTIGLIASGERGKLLGLIDIVDCREDARYGYAWVVRNPRKFAVPVEFAQRYGCVTWVNVTDARLP